MEGSAAVAPAAADADGQVQAPAAPDALGAEQPQAPAPDATDPNSPEADVRAQMEALKAEIAELRGQQPPPSPDDFFNELAGEDGDTGFTPEEVAALQAGQTPGQADPAQQEEQLAELDSYVNERIQQALDPMVQERQMEQLEAFVEKHPDILENEELRESMVATMQGLAGRWGKGAEKDVGLLKLAYTGAKAELSDAGAVPAEQAGASGASLETGAGQTQVGEDSEADAYRKLLTGAGSNPLA